MSPRGQRRGQGDPGVRTQRSLDPHKSQPRQSAAPRLMKKGEKGTEGEQSLWKDEGCRAWGCRLTPKGSKAHQGMVVSPGWSQHGDSAGKAAGSGGSGVSPLLPCVKQEQGRVWRQRAGGLAGMLSGKEAGAARGGRCQRGPGLPKRDPRTDRTGNPRKSHSKEKAERDEKLRFAPAGNPLQKGNTRTPGGHILHQHTAVFSLLLFSNNPNKHGGKK